MPHNNKPLFSAHALEAPDTLADALAPPASKGHFDELRGHAQGALPSASASRSQSQSQGTQSQSQGTGLTGSIAAGPSLSPNWTTFFNFLGTDGFHDLNHRTANLRRQISDNGVTYNVYADANGPQRPWSLDLFPLIISGDEWAGIEAGIQQRTRLLNTVMAAKPAAPRLAACCAGAGPPRLPARHAGCATCGRHVFTHRRV